MSPVSFFLFVNIVRVMDIQLHIPIISLLSQTETFLQFLLKFFETSNSVILSKGGYSTHLLSRMSIR